MRTATCRAACILILLLTSSFGSAALSNAGTVGSLDQDPGFDESSQMRDFLERYATDRAGLNRFYNISTSPVRLERMKEFYAGWQNRLKEMDFNSFGLNGRIDFILTGNILDQELRRISHHEEKVIDAKQLLPFADSIIKLEESRREMEPLDPEEGAAALDEMTKQIKELRKTLEDSLKARREGDDFFIKKSVVNRAAKMSADLTKTLKQWFDYFSGYDPMFNWWASDPYKKSDEAIKDYTTFLREKILGAKKGEPDPIVGDPIGRQALLDELAFEMIPYSPEELIELAEREYDWCEEELKRASRELGYGEEWLKAIEYVKTLHMEPGKQDELIKDLALEAIAFLDEHELVTIPDLCRETWRIEMMPPERQLTTPYFTYGGQRINVSFPTDGMTHEQKLMSMRGNNIHFSRATVQHELIPGHHLQGFAAERHRTYRSVFRTAFLGEGWALHWEMLLWDLNFPESPENRIGMLFWRIHRCARIIVSLKFHLEQMTPEEMIDFLVNKVGHEKDGATSEVRRYVGDAYGPLYQCAYLVGGWQLRALHKDLVGSGSMTDREFHDAVLRENSIPIEMIRASLTGQRLRKNFKSGWRFMDR